LAYRPFDSTDAAVADRDDVELSPISSRHDDNGPTWISPSARLNYGFAEDWEVVLEGQAEHPRQERSTLVDDALSLKRVWREGSLQDKSGLSIATEASVLLPGINDESGAGVGLTGIASERWDWGTLHVNLGGSRSREGRGEIFFGTILEGPEDWPVRPAAEFVYDREFGNRESVSFLAGLIWRANDHLAFDLGVRQARIDSRPETEIRAGLTFAFAAS
jgi:outer membrane receptor protein involved in Fe transport